jgi:transposase
VKVGEDKYDATAVSMVAVLRYGAGLPFHRIERLQACLGLPVSSSTQWDLVNEAAGPLQPILAELIRYGAQGELFHNDDTSMKILAYLGKRAAKTLAATAGEASSPQRAVFTSGLVVIREGRKIILFFTGRKHAGENLAEVLSRRACERPPPIQMCDALSRNVPKLPSRLEMILANCLAHGRRQFVDVLAHFPDECRYVIETLAGVYRNDEIAGEERMSPEERLAFHKAQSRPLMDGLHAWFREQLDEKKVEPHCGLGQAIAYMIHHWQKLTVFLRVPGAPLDNNVAERALKKAILHRKNSLLFKTPHGAAVGDLYMSLIATCEANGVNPLTYLTELMGHPNELQANPAD